jgi:hypothetical protein
MPDTAPVKKDELRSRVTSDICARCRKTFQKGHRTTIAYIVDRVGRHPANLQAVGTYFLEEFEVVHIDCTDPYLRNIIRGT